MITYFSTWNTFFFPINPAPAGGVFTFSYSNFYDTYTYTQYTHVHKHTPLFSVSLTMSSSRLHVYLMSSLNEQTIPQRIKNKRYHVIIWIRYQESILPTHNNLILKATANGGTADENTKRQNDTLNSINKNLNQSVTNQYNIRIHHYCPPSAAARPV